MKAHSVLVTLGCGLAVLAGACTFTRQGTLTSTESGVKIPIKVDVGAESATVTGKDPATGERFEGTFHLDRGEREPTPVGMGGPVPAIGGGAVSPGTGPRPATGRPPVIDMSGRLEGDKGTSLRCSIQVKRGLNLEGTGACRSGESDSDVVLYRIRF